MTLKWFCCPSTESSFLWLGLRQQTNKKNWFEVGNVARACEQAKFYPSEIKILSIPITGDILV